MDIINGDVFNRDIVRVNRYKEKYPRSDIICAVNNI